MSCLVAYIEVRAGRGQGGTLELSKGSEDHHDPACTGIERLSKRAPHLAPSRYSISGLCARALNPRLFKISARGAKRAVSVVQRELVAVLERIQQSLSWVSPFTPFCTWKRLLKNARPLRDFARLLSFQAHGRC